MMATRRTLMVVRLIADPPKARRLAVLAGVAMLGLVGCSDNPSNPTSSGGNSGTVEEPAPRIWLERTGTGVDFVHQRFMTPGYKYLPETAGAGVAMLDVDADGDLDLYFVNGRTLPRHPQPEVASNRLYVNQGNWQFDDVTDTAGVGDTGYGMGATAPDLDNDGLPEIYVTNVEANVLYHNQGKNAAGQVTLVDVTGEQGLADARWSTAAGWADDDRDGDLDLYLANYAVCDFENYTVCTAHSEGQELVSYCHPRSLASAPDVLFRNVGGLQFQDVTEAMGVTDQTGKGLAVLPMDHDSDGWPDWFVANDSNANYLWTNQQGQRFVEEADFLGVAVSGGGASQACMGTDVGDVNGDGEMDVFSANFGNESNVLYLRVEGDYYEDMIERSGMSGPSYKSTGFGAELFDYDRDGDQDLMVVNGHIVDIVERIDPSQTFLQLPHFYENDGQGHFQEIGHSLSAYFRRAHLGRGLAVGDLDGDGDPDVAVNHNDHPAALLENRAGEGRHWLGLRLVGSRSPRQAIGARVWVTAGDRLLVDEITGSSSYLSWTELRLFFGLGDFTGACQVRIRWPSGQLQELELTELDRNHTLVEPE